MMSIRTHAGWIALTGLLTTPAMASMQPAVLPAVEAVAVVASGAARTAVGREGEPVHVALNPGDL